MSFQIFSGLRDCNLGVLSVRLGDLWTSVSMRRPKQLSQVTNDNSVPLAHKAAESHSALLSSSLVGNSAVGFERDFALSSIQSGSNGCWLTNICLLYATVTFRTYFFIFLMAEHLTSKHCTLILCTCFVCARS